MCEKIGLRLFLIRFHASDENGAEVRGRGRSGGILRHNHGSVVTARDSDAFKVVNERETSGSSMQK